MPVTITRVTPDLIPTLGAICYDAFTTLQTRHNVACDFDSPDTGAMVVGLFATWPACAGFVAKEDGKVIGSNFICFADKAASVGPITISPTAQSKGAGKLLMQAVLDEAKSRGVADVRLMQEAINTTSLSLYTKLGFNWRDACSLMVPVPATQDDPQIRPLTKNDLSAVDQLSAKHFGVSRVNEVAHFLEIGLPAFLLVNGSPRGYYIPGFIGHGYADNDDVMVRLLMHAPRYTPPPFHKFILPLSENNLHRTLLARGFRSLKLLNYMTTSEYKAPSGSWIPSIGM